MQNHEQNDLSSKTEWTLVCDTFVASGNERYITIGNFYIDSLSTFTPLDSVCSLPNPFNCASYYYIDGSKQASAIGTLVERKSRYTHIVKLENRKSKTVTLAFSNKIKNMNSTFKKSLTYDNGI